MNPPAFASWLRRRNSSRWIACSATISSQPSQLASSVPVQREASRSHRRLTLFPERQSARVFSTADAKACGSL